MGTIKSIVDDDPYIAVDPDGNEIGRGSKKDKRYVDCIEHSKLNGVSGEYRIIQPEVKVGLIASQDTVVPPNNPPEWFATPMAGFAWIAGVGGTYDLNQDTSDAEQDTLTFVKTAGTFEAWMSADSAGVITVTSSAVAGTYSGFVFTADDGTASPVASSSFSIVISAAGTVDFPRLGLLAIGGWGQTFLDARPGGMPGRFERVAKHDIVVIGPWREWVYAGSTGPAKDTSDIATYIKTFNANVIIYSYTIPTDIPSSSNIEPRPTARTKYADEQWWLFDGTGFVYPDDVVNAGGPFPDEQVNLSNHTTVDSAGIRAREWYARAIHANSTDSDGDWVSDGFGIRAEYDYDGIYQDIMRYEPRTAGDWDMDLDSDAKGSAIALAAKANGDIGYHAEWTVLESGFLHAGNYTQNSGVNGTTEYSQAVTSGYQDLVHGVFHEALFGRSSSIESFAGWDAAMRYYKRAMTLAAGMDPQHVQFDNWETDGFSESSPNVWDATHSIFDWGRYGLCSCLMDDGYYGFPTSGGYVDANILDEYSFNLGAAVDAPQYDGADVTTSNTGSGYNDYELGVYGRRFANGYGWVNPEGNGDQTITLPVIAGFRHDHLDATDYDSQDTGVNDGATNVTTLTLPERHGQITKLTAV